MEKPAPQELYACCCRQYADCKITDFFIVQKVLHDLHPLFYIVRQKAIKNDKKD